MRKNHPIKILLSSVFTLALLTAPSFADNKIRLEKVAGFDHQVTGVTVAKNGRVFVNFPRWTEDAPISVAEVVKGGLVPYPNKEMNSWRNTLKNKMTPNDHFICVQSVVADNQNNLWVLDPAAPGNERIVPMGPKLVKIDLAMNKVVKVISFDENAAPQGSYLNDIRISPDGAHGYITDSGIGALLVVDLATGETRRVLEKDPSTMVEKDVVVKINGRELRRPDGRAPEFNSDGIALSADGGMLYWQALTAKTLYKVPTAALNDKDLSADALKEKVAKAGENDVADGLWIDGKNTMYITSPQDNSIKQSVNMGEVTMLIQDDRLKWPDTMSQAADGSLYVTTSHIQESPWFVPGADKSVKTELWKINK